MSMIKLPSQVTLVEVGPRDGLQNEKTPISTAIKVELCKQLIEAGIHRLEAAAFVSPKWVPQMADGADVLAGLQALPDLQDRTVSYSALVPNLKGMEAAIEAGVQEAVVFTAASEAFTQKISIAPLPKASSVSNLWLHWPKPTTFTCVVLFPARWVALIRVRCRCKAQPKWLCVYATSVCRNLTWLTRLVWVPR